MNIDSKIVSDNEYFIHFQYITTQTEVDIDIHNIINYIRLKYTLDNFQYMIEYDNIEYSILNIDKLNQSIKCKLLLTKLNNKLTTLPKNTICNLNICLKTEIKSPELFIK
jgi:hypothetical protein